VLSMKPALVPLGKLALNSYFGSLMLPTF
jgi:hypothetical protein